MFDRIVSKELPRRAARRGAWSSGAAAFQAALVASLVVASGSFADPPPPPTVEVVFMGAIQAPRRPAPPPAAPAVVSAAHRAALARPGVRTVAPPRPTALLQPREVAPEMRMPAPDEPIEAIDPSAVLEGGDEGVVGGFAVPVEPERLDRGGIDEAPQYATAGFRRPAEVNPGCVAAAIRLPSDLAGFVSGPVTARFAVGRDGQVGRVEVMGGLPDPRLTAAIVRALQACRWIPGADPRGQPIALWVILPIRFEAG